MKQIILIFFSIALVSCDQVWFFNEKIMLGVNGYVYSPTNEPIDSVTVITYRDNEVIDTGGALKPHTLYPSASAYASIQGSKKIPSQLTKHSIESS